MRLNNLPSVFFVGMMILVGCGGGDSGTTETENITITGDYQVESLGSENTINANVLLGNTPKDLYLVLSNNAATSASATIIHNAKVAAVAQSKTISSTTVTDKPVILRDPQYVQDFSSQVGTLLSKAEMNQRQAKAIALTQRNEDIVGDQTTFCVNVDQLTGNCTEWTIATSQKVVTDITTEFGPKTLNVWVSDDSFGPGCSKSKCVTENMVNALADTFLLSGLENDIYDWVTNIYGEEWGNNTEGLIAPNDEITILLTDIDADNSSNGGVVGFFWAKDNFYKTTIDGSNERVMFYIDSVMFANGGSPWSIDDFWPKEIISTLAHEFTHMINFYQKRVLRTTDTDTWINEMLSESTEDLIATKIRHSGPRGVDYRDGSAGLPDNTKGRYPLFNTNNTLSLTSWNGLLADYSKVSAFGAYLVRNYGGAELLHNIMHNSFDDERAVVYAVNRSPEGSEKTFADLLSEWGVAVMLSDHDNLDNTPEYNTGWFTDSVYRSTTYEMGSINFFNYDPLPTIYTTSGTVQSQGNYYYKIGDSLTGDVTIKLELNGETEATLIAK